MSPDHIQHIANVLEHTNIRVTAVSRYGIELECTQREAELARDIAYQLSTPAVELHETVRLPTDYPRTWNIEFAAAFRIDRSHRPQSRFCNCGKDACNLLHTSELDRQSCGIQDNCGRGEIPDQVPSSE